MVKIAVMAVPERLGWARSIAKEAGGARVFIDHRHEGPWHNAKRAWSWLATSGSEWGCLIQDDVTLAKGFLGALERALAAVPLSCGVVSLYGSRKVLRGRETPFYRIRDGVWGQGVALRRTAILRFMAWERRHINPAMPPHDDQRVALWLIETGGEAWVMRPSIVDHFGDKLSTMGHRPPNPRRAADFATDASLLSFEVKGEMPFSSGNALKKERERYVI